MLLNVDKTIEMKHPGLAHASTHNAPAHITRRRTVGARRSATGCGQVVLPNHHAVTARQARARRQATCSRVILRMQSALKVFYSIAIPILAIETRLEYKAEYSILFYRVKDGTSLN